MQWVYQVFFLVGLIYAVVSFVLGNLLDFSGMDAEVGDMDFELDGTSDFDLDGAPDTGGFPWAIFLPLQPLTIVTFITTFGGLGIIGHISGWSPVGAFFIALISGWGLAQLLYRGVIIPLGKVKTGDISRSLAKGKKAQVMTTIYKKGFGTITYEVNGSRFTAPAKHIRGRQISTGTEVTICEIDEKNIFYVDEKQIEGGD